MLWRLKNQAKKIDIQNVNKLSSEEWIIDLNL